MDKADHELAKTRQSLTTVLRDEEAKLAKDYVSVKRSAQLMSDASERAEAAHAAQLEELDRLISSLD